MTLNWIHVIRDAKSLEIHQDVQVLEFQALCHEIRVFLWDGQWHSEDNRRLWAFKTAGLTSVPVQVVQKESVDPRKFTTENRGASIRMRGGW